MEWGVHWRSTAADVLPSNALSVPGKSRGCSPSETGICKPCSCAPRTCEWKARRLECYHAGPCENSRVIHLAVRERHRDGRGHDDDPSQTDGPERNDGGRERNSGWRLFRSHDTYSIALRSVRSDMLVTGCTTARKRSKDIRTSV